jgi:predicted ATP-dependent Lon-type protease
MNPFKAPRSSGIALTAELRSDANAKSQTHVRSYEARKQASVLLMPVAARRQLNDLPDELWTKINIEFYSESADAFFKSLAE